MSRIGKAPIDIPQGVEVKVQNQLVEVKGPKGKLARNIHEKITVAIEGGQVLVKRPDDAKSNRALHGLSRALINNMVLGVTTGFEKKLQIEGVGYRANLKGKDLELSLGYSHPVLYKAVEGINIEVGKKGEIGISGLSKELVGQVAADIRSLRSPDPYKGKGIRYADEIIIKKVGKTGAGGKK